MKRFLTMTILLGLAACNAIASINDPNIVPGGTSGTSGTSTYTPNDISEFVGVWQTTAKVRDSTTCGGDFRSQDYVFDITQTSANSIVGVNRVLGCIAPFTVSGATATLVRRVTCKFRDSNNNATYNTITFTLTSASTGRLVINGELDDCGYDGDMTLGKTGEKPNPPSN